MPREHQPNQTPKKLNRCKKASPAIRIRCRALRKLNNLDLEAFELKHPTIEASGSYFEIDLSPISYIDYGLIAKL